MKADQPTRPLQPPVKVLTSKQIAEVDRLTTELFGIPGLVLMENAGLNLYLALSDAFPELASRTIAILCGKGNNGGDGMVLARHLAQRSVPADVFLLAASDQVRGDARINLEAYRGSGETITEITTLDAWETIGSRLEGYQIIVDALLGTGITKRVEGLYARVVSAINSSPAFVLSVDIPSGMFSDSLQGEGSTVRANATVTFTAPKIAHLLNPDRGAIGTLKVVPIGSPRQLLDKPDYFLNQLTGEAVGSWLPERRADSHKGDYGHLVLACGSRGKSGAAVLSADAALRTGSGLVTVCTPDIIQEVISSFRPELMTEGLPATPVGTFSATAVPLLLEILESKDVLALGPGIGQHENTVTFVRSVVEQAQIPMVIDADALNALQGALPTLTNQQQRPLILTPHPGEFSRLIDQPIREFLPRRLDLARQFARDHKVWLVLKGFRTFVTDPDGQIFICPLGNPGMATAGMGDVLTGIVASLVGTSWAQGRRSSQETTQAVCAGVYLHSLAGDLAVEATGPASLTAGDVIASLGQAYRWLGDQGI